jgi:hypothetical protein
VARKALTPSPLLLAAALLAGGCRCGKGEEPSPPAPRLVFTPERLDLGSLVQDQEARGTVVVENDGTEVLQVRGVDPSRFCSGRIEPAAIAPGQSANLVVTCRSDLHGPLREGIDIRSSDPRLPKARVQVVGEVMPLLAFDLPVIALEMSFGEERSQDVRLVGTLAAQARPRLTGAAAPDTEILPLPLPSGRIGGYRLHCLGRKVGANAGNIVLDTGLPRPREIAIPYACTVTGTLQVEPSNPYFNLKVSGERAVRITVSSLQPGFEVRSVRVTDGPFAARFAHAEDEDTYRIDVTVQSERIADETRAIVGKLLIESNDRAEPRKEVPLFGSGRINKVAAPTETGPPR